MSFCHANSASSGLEFGSFAIALELQSEARSVCVDSNASIPSCAACCLGGWCIDCALIESFLPPLLLLPPLLRFLAHV